MAVPVSTSIRCQAGCVAFHWQAFLRRQSHHVRNRDLDSLAAPAWGRGGGFSLRTRSWAPLGRQLRIPTFVCTDVSPGSQIRAALQPSVGSPITFRSHHGSNTAIITARTPITAHTATPSTQARSGRMAAPGPPRVGMTRKRDRWVQPGSWLSSCCHALEPGRVRIRVDRCRLIFNHEALPPTPISRW